MFVCDISELALETQRFKFPVDRAEEEPSSPQSSIFEKISHSINHFTKTEDKPFKLIKFRRVTGKQ
jgi:hypothetical protein